MVIRIIFLPLISTPNQPHRLQDTRYITQEESSRYIEKFSPLLL